MKQVFSQKKREGDDYILIIVDNKTLPKARAGFALSSSKK